MILGFSHPALVVPDLEKALVFYRDMFGFEVWAEENWEVPSPEYDNGVGLINSSASGYILKGHNCYLELWQYHTPKKQGPEPATLGAHEFGIRHLAFEVDDVCAEFERLKELGGIVMNAPSLNVGQKAIYCRDPFGNIVELMETGKLFPSIDQLPGVKAAGAFDQ